MAAGKGHKNLHVIVIILIKQHIVLVSEYFSLFPSRLLEEQLCKRFFCLCIFMGYCFNDGWQVLYLYFLIQIQYIDFSSQCRKIITFEFCRQSNKDIPQSTCQIRRSRDYEATSMLTPAKLLRLIIHMIQSDNIIHRIQTVIT